MAKPHKRFPAAFFSTQVEEEEAPPPLETFLNGTSSLYAEQMYEMYLEDPSSVQETWRRYFENEENAVPYDSEDYNKPTSVPGKRSALIAGVRNNVLCDSTSSKILLDYEYHPAHIFFI